MASISWALVWEPFVYLVGKRKAISSSVVYDTPVWSVWSPAWPDTHLRPLLLVWIQKRRIFDEWFPITYVNVRAICTSILLIAALHLRNNGRAGMFNIELCKWRKMNSIVIIIVIFHAKVIDIISLLYINYSFRYHLSSPDISHDIIINVPQVVLIRSVAWYFYHSSVFVLFLLTAMSQSSDVMNIRGHWRHRVMGKFRHNGTLCGQRL